MTQLELAQAIRSGYDRIGWNECLNLFIHYDEAADCACPVGAAYISQFPEMSIEAIEKQFITKSVRNGSYFVTVAEKLGISAELLSRISHLHEQGTISATEILKMLETNSLEIG